MDGRVRSEKGEIKTTTTTTSTQKNHASKAKRNESIFLVGITGTYLQRVNLCRKLPASLRLALQRLLSCTSKLAHNPIGLAVQDVCNYREALPKPMQVCPTISPPNQPGPIPLLQLGSSPLAAVACPASNAAESPALVEVSGILQKWLKGKKET